MTKIDEIIVNGNIVKFYDGIDFDFALNYTGDDMIVFFIDSWLETLKIHKRDNKINSLLGDNYIEIKDIDNNNIVIYQTNGYTKEVYITIKNKFIQTADLPWKTVHGIR